MDVVSMVRKTLSMTTVEDIILENVSFKDPLISFLEKLDHYTRYNIYGLKTALATFFFRIKENALSGGSHMLE